MDYWPELEDAVNQRELERQRQLSAYEARCMVEKLEKEISEKAALMERMEPWNYLEQPLRRMANELGAPVMALLRTMSIASLHITPEKLDKLILTFRITAPDVRNPPQLCWEASKSYMYGCSWHIVRLVVDRQGVPLRYELTMKDDQVLTCGPGLEELKAALVEAFRTGPLLDRNHKREPGIELKA